MNSKIRALETLGVNTANLKKSQLISIEVMVVDEKIENIVLKSTKNHKTIDERRLDFYKLIDRKTKGTFFEQKKLMLRNFYEYWSEAGDSDLKMRFEKEKSFDVIRRLNTWLKNEQRFNLQNPQPQQSSILTKKLGD